MKLRDILGSAPFIMFGIAVARLVPARLIYWLAWQGARFAARHRTSMFSTVRANLVHVVPAKTSDAELDAMAERAIYHAGCTYYDGFSRTMEDYEEGKVGLRISPEVWARTRSVLGGERPTMLVGAHMSNFDLAAQWFASQGYEIQALSLSVPDSGTQVVNMLRERRGLIMTPIDASALRVALTRLKAGGIVLTGIDRSVSENDEPLPFFGAPARLPTGHIRLALQTNARVLVACCVQDPDGTYVIHVAPPLEMERIGDRRQNVRHNALRAIAVIEDMIRMAPDQWMMFVPVWRDEDIV